jgi:hypothetical protein
VSSNRASSGLARANITTEVAIATPASSGSGSRAASSQLAWKPSSARSQAARRMPSRLPKRW